MKEEKDIQKLKEQFLNIFSSSINLNNLSRFQPEEITLKTPSSAEVQSINSGIPGSISNKEININVNVEGAKGNITNEYKKVVMFNNSTNTYDVKLKKNKPLDKILNSSSNFIKNVNPLNITKIVNSSDLKFVKNFNITQAEKKKKLKNKKPIENMNFVFDTPYSFFTNTGNYYIRNTQNNINKNKANNYYTNNDTVLRQVSPSIVNNINNTTTNENTSSTIINPTKNEFKDIINNNNISSFSRNEDGSVTIQNNIEKNDTRVNNTNRTLVLNPNSNTTLVDNTKQSSNVNNNTSNNNSTNIFNTKSVEVNKQTENKIFKHNITQLDSPSYSFTSKEQYITIDKSKGETLQDIKKLTFNELNQRTVNRIQAKTITYNKENKLVVPAFAGGGEGIVSSTTPIVIGERGTESFQVIPQKDSGSAISSNPAASLRGEAPAEIKAGSDDKVSKAIEENVTKKKELNSDKALETNKNNDSKDVVNELKNAGRDITPDKGKRKTTARPADIKTDNKSLIIESFKRTTIGIMPVWRTQHM